MTDPALRSQDTSARRLWAVVLIAGSVLLTVVFACATPFAALATLAVLDLPRRDGPLLVLAVWLANQFVGYALLGYPLDAQSVAWGIAIGVAAVAAFLAAGAAANWSKRYGFPAAVATALVAAFSAYETVLIAASALLPSGADAFSLATMAQIALVNVIALAALLALHRALSSAGWLPQLAGARAA